jgi:hypothetical protein
MNRSNSTSPTIGWTWPAHLDSCPRRQRLSLLPTRNGLQHWFESRMSRHLVEMQAFLDFAKIELSPFFARSLTERSCHLLKSTNRPNRDAFGSACLTVFIATPLRRGFPCCRCPFVRILTSMRSNPSMHPTVQQLRCWIPVALRAPAAGDFCRSAARFHSSCPPTRVVLSLVFAPDTYKLRTSQVGIGESVARDTRIIWSIRGELR